MNIFETSGSEDPLHMGNGERRYLIPKNPVICGTGHRPNKLGGYGKPAFEKLVSTATMWLDKSQPRIVISGMALGWDQALAVAAIRMGLVTHAYVPFEGQENAWPPESQNYYRKVLRKCAEVKVVSPGTYSPALMQKRNERMVDDCDLVLALWDGNSGGTANCIRYAEKVNRPICNLWASFKS